MIFKGDIRASGSPSVVQVLVPGPVFESNSLAGVEPGVSTEGLESDWLGCILDEDSLQKLSRIASKYRFHVDGEGGEYETLVVAGPHMTGELEIDFVKHWDGVRGHLSFQ